MTKLNYYIENHGKINAIIYVLIDLKKDIKEVIVFIRKAKTQTMDKHLQQIHSSFLNPMGVQRHSLFLFQR